MIFFIDKYLRRSDDLILFLALAGCLYCHLFGYYGRYGFDDSTIPEAIQQAELAGEKVFDESEIRLYKVKGDKL